MDAYWRNRIYEILNQVGSGVPDERIFKLWKEVLDDMYGEDDSRKKAKEWLKTLLDLVAANRHLL